MSLSASPSSAVALSVVISTAGRSSVVAETLRHCLSLPGPLPQEIVVVDHGGGNDFSLPDVYPTNTATTLRVLSAGACSPAAARNRGASQAVHPVVLFLDDDIHPTSANFFASHLAVHQPTGARVAAFGPVSATETSEGALWTDHWYLPTANLADTPMPEGSNLSIWRHLVDDWQQQGFVDDPLYEGLEAAELVVRLRQSAGLQPSYLAEATALRTTTRTFGQLLRRQFQLGEGLAQLLHHHPTAPRCWDDAASILAAISAPLATDQTLLGDYLATVEGIFAWPRIEAASGRLGQQAWHAPWIDAVFQLARHQGLIVASAGPDAHLEYAYETALGNFFAQISQTMATHYTPGMPLSYVQAPNPQPPLQRKTLLRRVEKFLTTSFNSLRRKIGK